MLEKTFDHAAVEQSLYEGWERDGSFAAGRSDGAPYTIMIPPPNVTGSLHIGHALTMTLQDTLIRWRRMKGDDALWQPGTDHAGIATQMVVERLLGAEKTSRRELGRAAFLGRVWQWKAESGGQITGQLRRLGASLDWPRERFTMDDGLNEAVREVFCTLHGQGLIYRDRRLVNWDPKFQSAISDLEVESREVRGHLWHLRYPVEGADGLHLVVATTRPETMLGDTAVAVHPEDARYAALVGRHVILPLTGRRVPIVADAYSDPEKGTGAVKITPAHDFNDFAVGQRHGLAMPSVLDREARVTLAEIKLVAVPGIADPTFTRGLEGLGRDAARAAMVAELERLGLLEKVEPHTHQVPHGDRSGVVIEPLLTVQWYCDAKTLAGPAIAAVEQGRTVFVPWQWENTFFAWMRDVQPWCISRQLWWGHRIPAWYGPDGAVFVARTAAEAQAQADAKLGAGVVLTQDEDVLDTWFSSALWPFATMGWPAETPDLAYFYPTDMLTTAGEILRLWVARMLMTGLEFMGAKPFADVYIHATVLDKKGRRMSKSKGNGIDPVDMIEKYGADALRFSLLRLASKGQDIRFSEERVPEARNFGNKIWNAARFVRMNLPTDFEARDWSEVIHAEGTLPERWILSRLQRTIQTVNAALAGYDMDDACGALYEFLWNEYCDWFVELCKPALQGEDGPAKEGARATLFAVLQTTLRLLHPIMPFGTEEIWQNLPGTEGSISIAPYPVADESLIDPEAEAGMALVIGSITALRGLRAEFTPGGQENEAARAAMLARRFTVTAVPESATADATLRQQLPALISLARLGDVTLAETAPTDSKYVSAGVAGAAFFIPAGELLEGIDPAREAVRLATEIAKLDKELAGVQGRLNNPGFVQKAAPEAVAKAQEDVQVLAQRRAKLEARRGLL